MQTLAQIDRKEPPLLRGWNLLPLFCLETGICQGRLDSLFKDLALQPTCYLDIEIGLEKKKEKKRNWIRIKIDSVEWQQLFASNYVQILVLSYTRLVGKFKSFLWALVFSPEKREHLLRVYVMHWHIEDAQ